MGSFCDYLEKEVLDHIFGAGTRDFTSPTNIFVGLSSTDPTDDGSGITEVISANNGYARISTGNANWSPASGAVGTIQNSTELSYAQANSDWGIQSFFFLSDQGSAGNYLGHGTLTNSKDIQQGDTAKYSVQAITVTLD